MVAKSDPYDAQLKQESTLLNDINASAIRYSLGQNFGRFS